MKKTTVRYDKPGSYEVTLSFTKQGEQQHWVGIIDGRNPGEYELKVIAEHRAVGTSGRITVRGVAGARSIVKVHGMIKIHKAAQKTDDFLELRVLTMDKTAYALAEPMLEIEANDVKASHAASVGPVDPEQVLYLKSRGLSDYQAKEAILLGWLGV
jgi:Fe-S cluster assembly protein SufD